MIELRESGKITESQKSLLNDSATHYSAWLKAINNFIDYQEAIIKGKVGSVESIAEGFSLTMIIITFIAMLLGAILIIVVLGYVQRILGSDPEQLNKYAHALSQGIFNSHYPSNMPPKSVLAAMHSVQNNTEQAINEVNSMATALAKGNFTHRVSNLQTQGDWQHLAQGLNNSADAIEHVMTELTGVMNALNKGCLSAQIDTNAPGHFGNILQTAKLSLVNINHVVHDIANVMNEVAQGNFANRVDADAFGDLLTIKKSVNQSIDSLSEVIGEISNVVSAQVNGDLTLECRVNSNGQLKQLQDAINTSSRKLKSVVTQAVDASQLVNEAALQVSQGSSDLSSRVQEQATALEQTSATMHEMASAVQNNTANARKVADLAHQVQHQAGEGVGVMQQTIGAMQSIHEASSKISDIVSIIDGIAFQTNLLALNAAVEAARAGEHGRGFAVVASEVRALAQKSAEAAKDIKGLIDDSVQRVENGTQLAEKSGSVLNGITASIEQVAGMVEEIAAASNEQSTGISQVHNAMADIDRVTQENAALVEETTAAAESLSSEAKDLRESMAFFKTGQQSNARYHQPKQKQAHKAVKSLPSRRAVPALPAPNSRSANEWAEF